MGVTLVMVVVVPLGATTVPYKVVNSCFTRQHDDQHECYVFVDHSVLEGHAGTMGVT